MNRSAKYFANVVQPDPLDPTSAMRKSDGAPQCFFIFANFAQSFPSSSMDLIPTSTSLKPNFFKVKKLCFHYSSINKDKNSSLEDRQKLY